jgi:hypothetical protein
VASRYGGGGQLTSKFGFQKPRVIVEVFMTIDYCMTENRIWYFVAISALCFL